jgi:hypothetical protein
MNKLMFWAINDLFAKVEFKFGLEITGAYQPMETSMVICSKITSESL